MSEITYHGDKITGEETMYAMTLAPEAVFEQMAINRVGTRLAVKDARAAAQGYRLELLRLMGPADGTNPAGAELVLKQYEAALGRLWRATDAAIY